MNVHAEPGAHSGMYSIQSLYKIGRGPSSSHTMGPEKAALLFMARYPNADAYRVVLYGSLAKTGVGHGTDRILKNVLGVDRTEITCDVTTADLPHPNTLDFVALQNGTTVGTMRVFSVGGGDIIVDGETTAHAEQIVYPHGNFAEIAAYCRENNLHLWQYVEKYEGPAVWTYLKRVWETMRTCIAEGLAATGELPGGLHVQRRAGILYSNRNGYEDDATRDNRMICAYAFAAGEQNAAGGVIVTAPTCGACGVLPAVLMYYQQRNYYMDPDVLHALATAGIIGNVIRTNASISGAACGCQAEIGSACSMAAAALSELLGQSIEQTEYAAEVAMEHHLGLTCDPVRGLVQIPCIERNAVAAMRAINAVNLANFLTDSRKISFDLVVETMYQTGLDMSRYYKETSEGGLAKLYAPNVE